MRDSEFDMHKERPDVSRLLDVIVTGQRHAADELLPLVYEELRRLARAALRRESNKTTLQTTALVHEAYLKLVGKEDPGWEGRQHFYRAAAQAMRRILIDRARQRKTSKHGSEHRRVAMDDLAIADEPPPDEVLTVAELVEELEHDEPRRGEIVNLRYFVGLTNEETAAALGLSVGTIEREWRFIRAFLRRGLRQRSKAES